MEGVVGDNVLLGEIYNSDSISYYYFLILQYNIFYTDPYKKNLVLRLQRKIYQQHN